MFGRRSGSVIWTWIWGLGPGLDEGERGMVALRTGGWIGDAEG